MRYRKTWSIIFFFATYLPCLSQEAPIFDDPNACVIDTWSLNGVAKEQVKVSNKTEDSYLGLTVYCYNPEADTWETYGSIMLLGYNDYDSIESSFEDKLMWFRYFAVQPKNGKLYDYYADVRREDLCIYIIQPGSGDELISPNPWKKRSPERR